MKTMEFKPNSKKTKSNIRIIRSKKHNIQKNPD